MSTVTQTAPAHQCLHTLLMSWFTQQAPSANIAAHLRTSYSSNFCMSVSAHNVHMLIHGCWQAPGKLYHRINVISDILPSEWPPVQTRKGVPHPPPTHMLYRAALARALEPVKEGFKDMLHVAVGSDSRMFRAALVRLVARAAGKAVKHSCAVPGLVGRTG